jgi:phenylalanyl-tRNA synthetase beta chain
MKFTLSWLKEHLETDATLEQISGTLTAIGLEVEEIVDSSAALSAFTVAEILEASPHPDADKLQVCKVKSDEGELQIVCGAPNARAGIKVALAKVGALIPNGDFKIKKSKIRGVESCGMLCSSKELNLGDDHAGIMELPADAPIGAPIASVLGLNDPLIEIAITPNRGDCLGVYGIARDLAAAGLGTLKPISSLRGAAGDAAIHADGGMDCFADARNDGIDIELQTSQCRQFIGVLIQGVTNGPAPEWLQQKLTAIGLRPISALVDITNYFTHTYARPLHVYDADKLTGGIIVREGAAGEAFEALNDKSYTLKGGESVIADASGMLGLGGIVGGVPSSVGENTTNVLLECAWFEPEAIADAGRKHDILTDARYRFERTVDAGFMQQGAALAAQMIVDLCGGSIAGATVAGELDASRESIEVADDAINRLSGMPIPSEEQQAILTQLGFTCEPKQGGNYTAIPPSYRPDVTQLADIAEEVLRIYGYDNIAAISLPKAKSVSIAALSPQQQRHSNLRRELAARGLHECHHWAFMSDTKAALFTETSSALKLVNPISADLNQMRPTLLGHLIDSARRNMARGLSGAALCEVGPIFLGTDARGQQSVAASLRAGEHSAQQWSQPAQKADWTHAKADALALLAACGVDTSKLQIVREASDYYHPGRSGAIKLGPKNTLAYFGELHPFTLQAMDANGPMVACEVFIDAVPMPKNKAPQPLTRSDFPATERDFAFVVKQEVEAESLLKAIRSADKTLVKGVRLFDVYQGKGLGEDEKSLAIRIELQAQDHTLKEDEIEAISKKVIANAEGVGAKLRA